MWLELDYYQNFKMKCGEDAAMLQKFLERERIFEFLEGLNIDFDQVRVQVLGKEYLPSLVGVFSIIRAEESRRGVMLDNPVNEGSAMNSIKFGHNAETNRNERQPNREGVWCNYCKRRTTPRIPAGNFTGSLQMLEEREIIMGNSLKDKLT